MIPLIGIEYRSDSTDFKHSKFKLFYHLDSAIDFLINTDWMFLFKGDFPKVSVFFENGKLNYDNTPIYNSRILIYNS